MRQLLATKYWKARSLTFMKRIAQCVPTIILALMLSVTNARPQGTAFTYQGRLTESGALVSDRWDVRFTLFDSNVGGTAVAGPVTNSAVSVTNGLFTTVVDFGTNAFTGSGAWLELAVRTNGTGLFVVLQPRQQITPTPYALFAQNANRFNGTIEATQVSGTLPLSTLPAGVLTNGASGVNLAGVFTGDGAGVTNVSFFSLDSGGLIGLRTNQANFTLATLAAAGANPIGIASGDLNGDGRPDVISVNLNDATMTLLTNGGAGQFKYFKTLPAGGSPTSVAAADVNNDGRMDLVSVGSLNGTINVYTNNGSGTFLNPYSPIFLGGTPYWVLAVDVNFDSKVDLVTANAGLNVLMVLTNNGSGGFNFAATNNVGLVPASLTAADFNGDGKVDLACANLSSDTLTVLTNNGSGRFVTIANYAVGTAPRCVASADLNGDNQMDLVSANHFGDSLTVLTNNGSAGFVAAATINLGSGSEPNSVAAADMNGDGKVDLVSPNYGSSSLTVWLNNGPASFTSGVTPVAGYQPYAVITTDVNNDNKPDLVAGNSGDSIAVLTNGTTSQVVFANTLSGDASGLTGISANAVVGGLSTNVSVSTPSGTRSLIFVNGILRAVR